MKNKVVVVTGANAGIGKITALELAKQGATVVMLCRNEQKALAAQEDIFKASGNKEVHIVLANLAEQAQIHQAAQQIQNQWPVVDVLVNNAGLLMGKERQLSPDGIEMTLSVNHLAPFLLTGLLLPQLQASPQGRIVTVSSEAHRFAKFNINNLQFEHGYSGIKAYALSKLCNVLFTRQLAHRLQGTPITANCLHPGAINSSFGHNTQSFFGGLFRVLKPFMISVEKGARTNIYLASSPDVAQVSGAYYNEKQKARQPSAPALNITHANSLWAVSETLTHFSYLA